MAQKHVKTVIHSSNPLPVGGLAQAHQIAPLIVFLASDESAFVTGQADGVDGGMTI